jgi:hypothetical protein
VAQRVVQPRDRAGVEKMAVMGKWRRMETMGRMMMMMMLSTKTRLGMAQTRRLMCNETFTIPVYRCPSSALSKGTGGDFVQSL